jgi:small GTP-binding protein
MIIQAQDATSQYKVVLLGDSRVGKTTLISRKAADTPLSSPKATVGCHCHDLTFRIENKTVNLQVWDTAGQEMYRALVPIYVRGANASVLVYDRTDHESFQGLTEWRALLDDNLSPDTPSFVVANKIDLVDSGVEDELGERFAAAHKSAFCRTSALTGQGVDALFQSIAEAIIGVKGGGVESDRKGISVYVGEEKSCGC